MSFFKGMSSKRMSFFNNVLANLPQCNYICDIFVNINTFYLRINDKRCTKFVCGHPTEISCKFQGFCVFCFQVI